MDKMWYGKLIEFNSTMGGLPDFFSNKFLYKWLNKEFDTLSETFVQLLTFLLIVIGLEVSGIENNVDLGSRLHSSSL